MNNQANINTSALQNSITPFPAFTEAVSLHAIVPRRLHKFFNGFCEALQSYGTVFPDHETANGEYYDSISAALSKPARLPALVRNALLTLETAALPENAARLDDAIQRRIPNVSLHGCCPIECALELWFLVPDELSQFQPPGEAIPAALQDSTTPQLQNLASHSFDVQSSAPPTLNTPANLQLSTCNVQSPSPALQHSTTPSLRSAALNLPAIEPWPEPVDGKNLLDALVALLNRFVVLPKWAAETLALWIVHTFAFHLRDVSTYIGLESPEKQCGKTTLLTVLGELANRAVTASNISPPAFFRVIEDLCPTLLIDEADTFLRGNEQLKGILNAGYKRKTAFVLRASSQAEAPPEEFPLPLANRSGNNPPLHHSTTPPGSLLPSSFSPLPSVSRFSCWCPKLISQIGRLPETLADRCIVIRIQRKTPNESCERLRNLEATTLKGQCARFVLDHQAQIAGAQPQLPSGLSDRATDIWEPLLVLAELAGGHWPELARQAALNLSASAQASNPIGSLLLDMFVIFTLQQTDRLFTRTLVADLSARADRPWIEMLRGKVITDRWLAQQLRPYGIQPRTFRIGEAMAKGYFLEDCKETFRRYIPRAELEALKAEWRASAVPAGADARNGAQSSSSAPPSPEVEAEPPGL